MQNIKPQQIFGGRLPIHVRFSNYHYADSDKAQHKPKNQRKRHKIYDSQRNHENCHPYPENAHPFLCVKKDASIANAITAIINTKRQREWQLKFLK
jgi:hypothetical protein